jgi:hypothetical protein
MRVLLVLLAGCAPQAPASLEDTEPPGAELPAGALTPPPAFELMADNFIAGATSTLYVEGVPNAVVRVMITRAGYGDGPCPAPFGGPCLELARPVRLLSWGIPTDAFGSGSRTIFVPPHFAGRVVTFQAGVTGSPGVLSNVVSRIIGPVGTVVTNNVDSDGDGEEAPFDCADFRTDVNSAASDPIGDGHDWSCDNLDGEDRDHDWLESVASGGADCDDEDAAVGEQPDLCDGLDNDCDGVVDPIRDGSGPTCPGLSCLAIDQASGLTASSGSYWIDPNGGDVSDAVRVECDMDSHGGGWTRVVNIRSGTNAHGNTPGAYGDIHDPNAAAKLADVTINELSTVGYWWYRCAAYDAFVKNTANHWVSQVVNGENWSIDRGHDLTFECAANRAGYVFSDHPVCDAGHTDYAATGIGEGSGCYTAAAGWNQNGVLWAK